MSPLVWDLAHIGHYEELWLLRELGAGEPTDPRFDDIYDAFRHPRSERPTLDILGPSDARDYIADVRKRALDVLAGIDLDADDPLLADGFVYGLVIHHEHQHDETLLATIQLMDDFAHPDAGDGPGAPGPDPADLPLDVLVEAGPFTMGTSTDPWAYDNERPAHVVDLPAFRIDTTPVTNAAYVEFVEAGGYDDRRWWTDEGWAWRTEAGLEHPQFWVRDRRRVDPPPVRPGRAAPAARAGAARLLVRGRRLRPLARRAPARPRPNGRRPRPARPKRAGSSDLGRRFGPDEVGAHPEGASAYGALDLLGGVWEWTASDFEAYPGFESFPYREYSEVFFGVGRSEFGPSFKVLRGGVVGDRPDRVQRHVPQLGPADPAPDLRRLPLRDRRLTRRHVPPPRVPRSSRRAPVAAVRRAARARAPGAHPRFQYAGPRQPGRLGCRVGHRSRRAVPLRARRCGTTSRSPGTSTRDAVLAAARFASPGSTRDVRNAAPFVSGPVGVLAQRLRLGLPRRLRRRAPIAADAASGRRDRGRHRQRGASSRSCSTSSTSA